MYRKKFEIHIVNISALVYEKCFQDNDFLSFFDKTLDIPFDQLDTLRGIKEASINDLFLKLVTYKDIEEAIELINQCSNEDKYFIKERMDIANCFKQELQHPILSCYVHQICLKFFSYVLTLFYSFKIYCYKEKLSFSDAIYDLVHDYYFSAQNN